MFYGLADSNNKPRRISSEEKVIKPEPEIYQRLFTKFNLKPEECIFADDRAENIEGGRRLGLDGIVFKDAKQYERELREYLAFHQDTIVTERLLLRRWKPSMTQDLTTYFVWIGGSCDYGHNFCTFAALNRSGILLDYYLVILLRYHLQTNDSLIEFRAYK